MKKTVYDIVTERIIAELDRGRIPWKQPWRNVERPCNWQSQRNYHGINLIMLPAGQYATFQQIQKAGGRVNKGEKAFPVVFWKFIDVQEKTTDKDTGEKKVTSKRIPLLRYYSVFNVETQCTGIKPKKRQTLDFNPIEQCEKTVREYIKSTDNMEGPTLKHEGDQPCYTPLDDTVTIPHPEYFISTEHYYSTLFHELTHSTGHPKRCNREIVNQFGDEKYGREELVAELGAAFLCAALHIDNDKTLQNSAAYIQNWKQFLAEDKRAIVWASGRAEKATKFILKEGDTENITETEPEAIAV